MNQDRKALAALRELITQWSIERDNGGGNGIYEDLAEVWYDGAVLTARQRHILEAIYFVPVGHIPYIMNDLGITRQAVYATAQRGLKNVLFQLTHKGIQKLSRAWRAEEVAYIEANLHAATIAQLANHLHRPFSSTYVKVLELRRRDV